MKKRELDHWEVMPELRKELNLTTHKDTWGEYSANMLIRELSLEEALRNALVQLFAPEGALFHL